jgi:hypothetical protein
MNVANARSFCDRYGITDAGSDDQAINIAEALASAYQVGGIDTTALDSKAVKGHVSVKDFVREEQDRLRAFVENYAKGHANSAEGYPLTIPLENAGVLSEMVELTDIPKSDGLMD